MTEAGAGRRRTSGDEISGDEISAREKMRAAQREVGYRRFVYPKRVAAGKMTQAQADREIAVMERIALDYGAAAEAEEAQGKLL